MATMHTMIEPSIAMCWIQIVVNFPAYHLVNLIKLIGVVIHSHFLHH